MLIFCYKPSLSMLFLCNLLVESCCILDCGKSVNDFSLFRMKYNLFDILWLKYEVYELTTGYTIDKVDY